MDRRHSVNQTIRMRTEAEQAERLAFFTLKKVNKALRQFGMIQDGDRVAVAVSGGKDSLGLLCLLKDNLRTSLEKYSLVAIHVHGDARGPDKTPRTPALEDWLKAEGVEYRIEDIRLASGQELPMSCQRCAWSRRRTLFEVAAELGCNKLAYAHHADDLIQTYLMNLLYHGRSEGLAPVRQFFGGRFTLIRPLILVPEKEMVRLAKARGFSPPPPLCPMADVSRRETVRKIIALAETRGRQVRANLLRLALAATQRSGI